MNLTRIIQQMRVARKMGKISNEVQSRLMRRFAPRGSQLHWESMMRLRASIEKEIAPILAAKRAAEADCFQVKFRVENKGKATPKPAPRKVCKRIEDYKAARAWWAAMELKEREDRKKARKEAYLTALREHVVDTWT